MGEFKKNQLASPEWNNALLFSLNDTLSRQVFCPMRSILSITLLSQVNSRSVQPQLYFCC